MLKNDYMKEVENSLKIVKKEVDKSILDNEINKAYELINKEFKALIGLDITTINTLSFDTVKTIISRDNQYNAEKYIALGELLILQGSVCERCNNEVEKFFYYDKALMAFVEAYNEDKHLENKYLIDSLETIDELKNYQLEDDVNKNIIRIYKLLDRFDAAEDVLYELINGTDNKRDAFQFGIDFYNSLKDKSQEELALGNLPIDEVRDGITQLQKMMCK